MNPNQAQLAKHMSERDLQESVLLMAATLGWMSFHPYDSRRSTPGFPDLTLVHLEHGLLFVELKSEIGQLTRQQRIWRQYLQTWAEFCVWRPADWHSGHIEQILRGER